MGGGGHVRTDQDGVDTGLVSNGGGQPTQLEENLERERSTAERETQAAITIIVYVLVLRTGPQEEHYIILFRRIDNSTLSARAGFWLKLMVMNDRRRRIDPLLVPNRNTDIPQQRTGYNYVSAAKVEQQQLANLQMAYPDFDYTDTEAVVQWDNYGYIQRELTV